MTHGGKRPGSGPKRTQLDERRLMLRIAAGNSHKAIAADFGVSPYVISRAVKRIREAV